jgi:ferredoxin
MCSILFVKEEQEIDVNEGDNLRTIALDGKIDIYKLNGKLMNCNGYGQCGTCLVEVVDGMDNLSPRTAAENDKLKKRPESYRLACQTVILGNATIKTKP